MRVSKYGNGSLAITDFRLNYSYKLRTRSRMFNCPNYVIKRTTLIPISSENRSTVHSILFIHMHTRTHIRLHAVLNFSIYICLNFSTCSGLDERKLEYTWKKECEDDFGIKRNSDIFSICDKFENKDGKYGPKTGHYGYSYYQTSITMRSWLDTF